MNAHHLVSQAEQSERAVPPLGTLERWCFDFIAGRSLADKLAPRSSPAVDDERSWELDAPERRIAAPGRPPELAVVARSPAAPRAEALGVPDARARLLHTFVHHELQAAELFAWAVLAFPRTPREFRAGLVRLCGEELAHMNLYAEHMRSLGTKFGDHPVRDWFWQRVPLCADAASFVALQGLGLEGANLEHSARFAAQFNAAGDEAGARILERVERDEIGHVAFAVRWFERFTGAPLAYDTWRAALPAPLTPALMQGRPLNRDARRRAGMNDAFLARLLAEPPIVSRRPNG
jgi:uncharacterized ferritin-like protein (DUF455 family)